jgi:hypothetical protein
MNARLALFVLLTSTLGFTQQISTKANVLGFWAGESPHDAGVHAAALGLPRLTGCKNRSVTTTDYIDCEFLGTSTEKIQATFHNGRLQRVEYNFRVERYSEFLLRISEDYGRPHVVHTPDGSELSKDWGGLKEKVEISLGKTYDNSSGWITVIFNGF